MYIVMFFLISLSCVVIDFLNISAGRSWYYRALEILDTWMYRGILKKLETSSVKADSRTKRLVLVTITFFPLTWMIVDIFITFIAITSIYKVIAWYSYAVIVTEEKLVSKTGVKSKMNKHQKKLRSLEKEIKVKLGVKEDILEKGLFRGPGDEAQTRWDSWVYNLVPGGTFSNPYLGELNLPNFPLSDEIQKSMTEVSNDTLQAANKYLAYQTKRLNSAVEERNAVKYWVIANALMKNSQATYMYFLNKAAKGWYFRNDINTVWEWERKVSKKARYVLDRAKFSRRGEVNLSRSYIEKANGKLRPIGAPNKEDRIYLSMMAFFLQKWVEPLRDDKNHGTRKGKGVWSAWLEFLTKMKDKENIFEYDIKGFFNRIPLMRNYGNYVTPNCIQTALDRCGVPQWVTERIIRINQSYPHRLPENNRKLDRYDLADPEMWMFTPGKVEGELMYGGLYKNGERVFPKAYIGLTQGSPLSPLLGSLYLRILKIGERIAADERVEYADDGIFGFNQRPAWWDEWEKKLKQIEEEINKCLETKLYSHRYTRGLWEEMSKRAMRIKRIIGRYQGQKVKKEIITLKKAKTNLDGFWNLNTGGVNVRIQSWYPKPEGYRPTKDDVKPVSNNAFEFAKDKCGWLKLNGKWLTDEVKFLGAIYRPKEGTLNGTRIEDINFRSLWKIVGRTYNLTYPEEWTWKIHKHSLLRELMDSKLVMGFNEIVAKMDIDEREKTKKVVYLLSGKEKALVMEASTICTAAYLKELRIRKRWHR